MAQINFPGIAAMWNSKEPKPVTLTRKQMEELAISLGMSSDLASYMRNADLDEWLYFAQKNK